MRVLTYVLIVLVLCFIFETQAKRGKSQGVHAKNLTKLRKLSYKPKSNRTSTWSTDSTILNEIKRLINDATIHNISVKIIEQNCAGNGGGNGGCSTGITTDSTFPSSTYPTTTPEGCTSTPGEALTNASTPDATTTPGVPTPSPNEICNLPTEELDSIPDETLSEKIRNFCSSEVDGKNNLVEHRIMPDISRIKLQFRDGDFKYEVTMNEANRIVQLQEYNPLKKLVIFVNGLSNSPTNTEAIDAMAEVFHKRDEQNFMVVDIAQFVDSLYTWAAMDTDGIGEQLAKALKKLTQTVDIENVHLIGHSLGAHIVGAAASKFHDITGKSIPRVTGLDPSIRCFHDEDEQIHRLESNDADFVDVVHSNPGVLGESDPSGTVDVYLNGFTATSPNCQTTLCSHAEAWKMFAETVDRTKQFSSFLATECVSIMALIQGKCRGPEVYMGYAVSAQTLGTYLWKNPSVVSSFKRSRPVKPNKLQLRVGIKKPRKERKRVTKA